MLSRILTKTPKTPVKTSDVQDHFIHAKNDNEHKTYKNTIGELLTYRGFKVKECDKPDGYNTYGIDLIATSKNKTILIHCKSFDPHSKQMIRCSDIKRFSLEAKSFLEDHAEFLSKNMSLQLIISKDAIKPKAKKYINYLKSVGKKIDIKIIMSQDAMLETDHLRYSMIEDKRSCPRCNQGHLVLKSTKGVTALKDTDSSSEFIGCSRSPFCGYTQKIYTYHTPA